MGVDSPLELYTTLIAWRLYAASANAIIATGLVWFPFLAILYQSWRAPAESQDAKDAFSTSTNRLLISYAFATIIMIFAFLPNAASITLTSDRLRLLSNDETVAVDGSDTTYAGVFEDFQDPVEVPILFYGAMALFRGVNHLVIAEVENEPDLRNLYSQLAVLNIPDLGVRANTSAFVSACFQNALAKYRLAGRDNRFADYETWETLYQDSIHPSYLGADIWVDTPGFYARCTNPRRCGSSLRATSPVRGFPQRSDRDIELVYDNNPTLPGRPYCDEWWLGTDGVGGLKDQLLEQASAQGFVAQEASEWSSFFREVFVSVEDAAIESMLANARTGIVSADFANELGSADSVKSVVAGIGIEITSIFQSLRFYAIVQALPIAQALLIMGLILVAPWILLFTLFDFGKFFYLLLALFIVMFWSVLWHFASLIDNWLLQALAPVGQLQPESGNQLQLLELMLIFLFIGLPGTFSLIVGFVGVRPAQFLSGATNDAVNTSGRSADQGGQAAIHTANRGPATQGQSS